MSHGLPPQLPPGMNANLTTQKQSSSSSKSWDSLSDATVLQSIYQFAATPVDRVCRCEQFRRTLVGYLYRVPVPFEAVEPDPDCPICRTISNKLVAALEPWSLAILEENAENGDPLSQAIMAIAGATVGVSLQ
jgi:hypothetical protein